MYTLTCKLIFKEGDSVTATIRAKSANADYPVEYSGSVDKLPVQFDKTDPAVLESYFRNLAHEIGADLSIVRDGEYDLFAE